jgi:hypothetical protein
MSDIVTKEEFDEIVKKIDWIVANSKGTSGEIEIPEKAFRYLEQERGKRDEQKSE